MFNSSLQDDLWVCGVDLAATLPDSQGPAPGMVWLGSVLKKKSTDLKIQKINQ